MNGKKWQPSELYYLRLHYPHKLSSDIADELNRKLQSVHNKAYLLGLRKTEKFLSEMVIKLKKIRSNTVFKTGNEPWNKGKKMSSEVYDKIKSTMFTKGHLPKNTKEDGALSVRKDKNGHQYVYIREALSKWTPLHRYVWKRNHGIIPKGHNIIFADGNHTNFSIENLICISNAELAKRNSIHRYPEEIKALIRINAKLKREIKKHIKEEEQL